MEDELSETFALRYMTFSHRLFDIKVFQRRDIVAYFENTDLFVVALGESAQSYNIQTGLLLHQPVY